MATTLEERAIKKAMRMLSPNARPTTRELLIEMATEQRKIDIDKACEVYRKELLEIIDLFNTIGKDLYNIDDLGKIISLEGSIKDFRKAMEK